jgi:hypothetical protein
MVLTVITGSNPPPTVTSVSGGGVATWSMATRLSDTTETYYDSEIWTGTVTTTGPSIVSIKISGYSNGNDLTAQEFSAGADATWSIVSSASVVDFNTPFAYPPLSAANPNSLYYGLALRNNSGSLSGASSGFTYIATGLPGGDLITYDANASGLMAPTAVNSSAGSRQDALAVLVTAS